MKEMIFINKNFFERMAFLVSEISKKDSNYFQNNFNKNSIVLKLYIDEKDLLESMHSLQNNGLANLRIRNVSGDDYKYNDGKKYVLETFFWEK